MSRTFEVGRDRLILPGADLAGCLFGALLRDTRGRGLSPPERFNHFPASPLCAVTWFFEGRSHAVAGGRPTPEPLPRLLFAGPQSAPVVSWNPGPVIALSLGLYPDAWQALTGQSIEGICDRFFPLEQVLEDGPLRALFLGMGGPGDFAAFEASLAQIWQSARPAGQTPAAHRLSDWSRALIVRAAQSGGGRGLRQMQRRVRHWAGHNRRALSLYSQIEELARLSASREADLAGLAQEAGFSDQSHMGRTLKRVTGRSPAALNRAIQQDETLWAYRLMGERF